MSRIKKEREKRGLTQQLVAHHLGVSDRTIRNWESDVHTPTGKFLDFLIKEIKTIKVS